MYSVLSAFTSSSVSLIATTKASAFSFVVRTLNYLELSSIIYSISLSLPSNYFHVCQLAFAFNLGRVSTISSFSLYYL